MSRITLSHCASLIRIHDHDRYLCALFAPADVREAWFALFAFNHELAAIPDSVSEEMIGFMRFAWWRETLEEIYAAKPVRRHPVAEALMQVISAHRLPRNLFDALLDARESNMGGEAFTELAQWEEYFRATSSRLMQLCALVAGIPPSNALEKLGIAWGCTGMARRMSNNPMAILLTQAANKHIDAAKNVPHYFRPFFYTAKFYYKILDKKKNTDQKYTAFQLVITLVINHWLGR